MTASNSRIIENWKRTQDNGKILYEKFPQYNLSTQGRNEVHLFKKFCDYHGKVLDVGSGPIVPSYLEDNKDASMSFGIDPLISSQSNNQQIILVKAVGEHLPFQNDYFDTISFATSFDHVINPESTLLETKRVLNPQGYAIFWVEKEVSKMNMTQRGINKIKHILKNNKNKIDESLIEQERIIQNLEVIPDCIDKFHLRHIKNEEFLLLANSVGFKLISEEEHQEFHSTFLKFMK